MFEKENGKENLIHNKELGAHTTGALKTDCAPLPYNTPHLEEAAPRRDEAPGSHCSPCSGSVLTRNKSRLLRGPAFHRRVPLLLIPRGAPPTTAKTTGALGFIGQDGVTPVTTSQYSEKTHVSRKPT